jgi:TniQ
MVISPERIPFAPRPIADESMPSWLLRVAASNFVSADELLQGFASRYGWLLVGGIPEHSFPDDAVAGLSKFCRVPPKSIHALDLRRRISDFSPSLLLSFPQGYAMNPSWINRRAHYSFCLRCVRQEQVVYVRWDWTLACLLRCPVHHTELLERCAACQAPDPLIFSGLGSQPQYCCRFCGASLTDEADPKQGVLEDREIVLAVEGAYREALLGRDPHPGLLGRTTSQSFRGFVEGLLILLTNTLGRFDLKSPGYCSRQDILLIITALIRNASPSANPSTRRQRYRSGATLWANLLATLPPLVGSQLEDSSRHWPLTLRRRFAAGLRLRIRKRWPYNPYRPAKDLERRTERSELGIVFALPQKPG